MSIAWLFWLQQALVIRPSNAIYSDEKLDTGNMGCSRLLFVHAVNATKSTKLAIRLYLRSQYSNCSVFVVKVRVPTIKEIPKINLKPT